MRDFLLSYQQRNPATPLLVALSPSGEVLARTDRASADAGSGRRRLAGASRRAPRTARTVVVLDGRPYHAAGAAAEAGGNVFGHVIAAVPVDEAFAHELREATQDEIVLLSANGVVASSFRGDDTPWPSLAAWRKAGGRQRSIARRHGRRRALHRARGAARRHARALGGHRPLA